MPWSDTTFEKKYNLKLYHYFVFKITIFKLHAIILTLYEGLGKIVPAKRLEQA